MNSIGIADADEHRSLFLHARHALVTTLDLVQTFDIQLDEPQPEPGDRVLRMGQRVRRTGLLHDDAVLHDAGAVQTLGAAKTGLRALA